MAIAARISDRLAAGLKKYQPVLASAKSRDVNESDTSLIATDILAEVFGYDKYVRSHASCASAARSATWRHGLTVSFSY